MSSQRGEQTGRRSGFYWDQLPSQQKAIPLDSFVQKPLSKEQRMFNHRKLSSWDEIPVVFEKKKSTLTWAEYLKQCQRTEERNK